VTEDLDAARRRLADIRRRLANLWKQADLARREASDVEQPVEPEREAN
jgi:hypothetical protein